MVSYYNNSMMYGGRQQENMSPTLPAATAPQQMPVPPPPHHQPSPGQPSAHDNPVVANWIYQRQQISAQAKLCLEEVSAAAEVNMPTVFTSPTHNHPIYLQYHPAHQAIFEQHQQQMQQYQQQMQQHQQQYQMDVVSNANMQQSQQPPINWNHEEANNNNNANNDAGVINNGEHSPALTHSGSEISPPSTPASPSGNNNSMNVANNNAANVAQMRGTNRSPFEWMKKNQYQPNPGKTRTKEKYRVVYSEHQRLELEKEFYSSKYITIRRKTELAGSLSLSERQVKIWFQNRRAKERKQTKKRNEMGIRDIKPTVERGIIRPATVGPPVSGMANLSLNNVNMGGLMGNLMPGAPSPSLMAAHHHHPHPHPHPHHQLFAPNPNAPVAHHQVPLGL